LLFLQRGDKKNIEKMFLTTEKKADQIRYVYIVLGLLLVWSTYIVFFDSVSSKKGIVFFVIPLIGLFVMFLRGKFILEMDTDSSMLLISNRSALFNRSVPALRNDLKINKNQFSGFWIENHLIVKRLYVRFNDNKGIERTKSFSLSSIRSEDLKAIKASLGRITVQNKRREAKAQLA
jgi:hypothetical protein